MSLPPRAPSTEIEGLALAGGRAAAVTPLLEAAFIRALAAARPEDVGALSALNVEVCADVITGAPLRAAAWVERATRTVAFMSGDIFDASGARVAMRRGGVRVQGEPARRNRNSDGCGLAPSLHLRAQTHPAWLTPGHCREPSPPMPASAAATSPSPSLRVQRPPTWRR